MAYNLKYMFRESLSKARGRFEEQLDVNLGGEAREVYASLVRGAFDIYRGLVDQPTLAETDFLTNPRALVAVVLESVAGGDERRSEVRAASGTRSAAAPARKVSNKARISTSKVAPEAIKKFGPRFTAAFHSVPQACLRAAVHAQRSRGLCRCPHAHALRLASDHDGWLAVHRPLLQRLRARDPRDEGAGISARDALPAAAHDESGQDDRAARQNIDGAH